ncbi:MAG TPA: CHASE2 domain-containing protein [Candidatus Competibacteraceae bacterium]|nr:CHASE2 domain-containing protein [Gammaproteobacteria bacterium]HPF59082.1 CHASE2 domain-containing protein [Candidatus Competibacteraceae bacterium]HRX70671.1 CHASE2 domain-containing protein [Candidatus Competibacteraceae bacterium]
MASSLAPASLSIDTHSGFWYENRAGNTACPSLMKYINFDLWLDSRIEDRYPVRAASPMGEVRELISLDPYRHRIEQSRNELAMRDASPAKLIDFGGQLYQLLFGGQVALLFEQSVAQSPRDREQGIRIRLRIEAPELIVLPWEFLYWPQKECFLGTSIKYPIVRYLEIFEPIENLEVALPLKMLVVIPDSPDLDAAHEKTNLLRILAGLDKHVQLTCLEGRVTTTRISDALLEERFHLLHFIGHGEFENGQAFLQLNTEDGDRDYIDDSQFASLLANHPTLKLVFLNSCKGAETSLSTPMAGMAYRLVKQSIPAVIAMQFAIYDEAAIVFSQQFYHSLFKGRAQGRVEFAVSHARNHLLIKFPGERDIGAPVLFMRASEGLLFNIVTGDPIRDLLSNDASHRTELAIKTHEQNIKFWEQDNQKHPGVKSKTALDQNIAELNRLKQKIKLRRILYAIATGTSLFAFFLSWIQLFDFLPPAVRIESYAMWLASAFFERPAGHPVALVTIDGQTEKEIGKPFGRDWRREHAILIDRLSQAGAKVIAFDLFFEEPSAYDQEFADAVARARDRHATVVAGFRALGDGQPELIQIFKDAGVKSGLLCIGKKWGTSQIAPLVIKKAGQTQILHSLALEISAAFLEQKIVVNRSISEINLLNPVTQHIANTFFISEVNPVQWEQPACPAIGKQDISASSIIDASWLDSPGNLRSKTRYELIINHPDRNQLDRFNNKIVLIGIERKEDLFPVLKGLTAEEHYGIELHFAIIQSLLSGKTIQPLSSQWQFFTMLVLGLMGGLARLQTRLPSLIFRIGISIILFLVYFAIASYIFQAYRIILNTVYDILAFWVSYWTAGIVKRRGFQ